MRFANTSTRDSRQTHPPSMAAASKVAALSLLCGVTTSFSSFSTHRHIGHIGHIGHIAIPPPSRTTPWTTPWRSIGPGYSSIYNYHRCKELSSTELYSSTQQNPKSNNQTKSNHESNRRQSNPSPSSSSSQASHFTTAQKQRLEFDQARLERTKSNFATPGYTSAIPGARDYEVDVERTEREYWESMGVSLDEVHAANNYNHENYENDEENDEDELSEEQIDETNLEKYVTLHTTRGLTHLRMLRLPQALRSFARVYQVKPEAYLWQDGIVKYYLGRWGEGAESLARNAVRYEARFGGDPASEERIWRDACELKLRHSSTPRQRKSAKSSDSGSAASAASSVMRVRDARMAMLGDDVVGKRLVEDEMVDEQESIENERRKVIRLARQLFSSSLHKNPSGVALARAQLQSMCSDSTTSSSSYSPLSDPKMYKLHSHFYLGLHYDALGQSDESKRCMKMALKTCARSISGNNQDITYLLPVIHMTVRDWYDDDSFDDLEEVGDEVEGGVGDDGVDFEIDGEMGMGSMGREETGENDESYGSYTEEEMEMIRTFRESIRDMRVVDLREELKKKKLKVAGSKKVLQDRLVNDLKREGGIS